MVLIFSYIRRLGPFFLVQIFELQYFLGVSENEYFFGYLDFLDIFWGHQKIGLVLGVISMHFLKVKVQNGGNFLGLQNVQKMFVVLDIPDIFWG